MNATEYSEHLNQEQMMEIIPSADNHAIADFTRGAGQQVPKDTRNCGISPDTEMRESRCSMEFTLDELMASNRRFKLMLGVLNQENQVITETIPNKNRSQYSQEKWQYLLYAPFNVGSQCCNIMKKAPAHKYFRDTGRHPMTAQMAQESRLRTQQWIRNGCNGFNLKIPTSNPMAFWTEQDVLQYIKQNNLPLASVYGDIVYTDEDGYEYDNPMFNDGMKLKTTGCDRTGCMFCGFGCHLEKDKSRFVMMKQTHPKQYEYIMKSWEDGGLNYKEVIDWLNENGNLNIKY